MTTPPVRQIDIRAGEHTLRCYVVGSLEDPVIVGHPGTPTTGLRQSAAFLLAGIDDVCHVTFDRPGYGASTRIEGRSIADMIPLVRAVLDELGVARAAVYGHSAGGPHALASAALLPERITRAAVLAGVAPVGHPELDFFEQQTPFMRDEMLAALNGQQALRDFLHQLEQESPVNAFSSVLTDGDNREADEIRAFSESLADDYEVDEEDGYVDDMRALATPWGFELGSIAVPVLLLQGTDDLMVPPHHAEWLRDHIPGAALESVPGHGHMLQQLYARAITWLTAREREPGTAAR
jgi:pimeloyl-ACP methyl ester carboxylesterase